jgi:tripartite ATP-independent transporter DctP family solute receptor
MTDMCSKATRRRFVTAAGATAGILAAPALIRSRAALAQSRVTLKVAHAEPPENSLHRGYERFKELVEERTGGEIDVRIYPAGQLGGIRDAVEGMRLGTIELSSTGPDYTSNLVPMLTTASLYYIWRSSEHAWRVLDGEVSERLSRHLIDGAGLRILTWGYQGFRSVISKGRAVASPGDLAGMRVRVPEARLHVLPFQALGANPTPVPYAEVYTALQTNVVEAAEGVPAAVVQMKFYEVVDFFSLTEHLFNPVQILMSERVFQTLSGDEQAIVTASARDAFAYQRGLGEADNAAAMAEIERGGVQIVEADVDAFRELVRPVWDDLLADLGDEAREIVAAIEAAA